MTANRIRQNKLQKSSLKGNITTKQGNREFYGPFEHVPLRRGFQTNSIKNNKDQTSLGRRELLKENMTQNDVNSNVGTTQQKIVHETTTSGLATSSDEAESSSEWDPVTHWTLEVHNPYSSYSYHYHNVKSRKSAKGN